MAYLHPGSARPYAVESIEDTTIVFGALAWSHVPSLHRFERGGHGLCYVPFQGWKNGIWHDGPLIRLNEAGEVTGFVNLGGSASLSTPLLSDKGLAFEACAHWIEDRDGEGAKVSLTQALGTKFGEITQGSLAFSRFDVREAVLVSLMRRAYPRATLVAGEEPPSPPWRRLLQNLGILHGRAPKPHETLLPLDLDALASLIPAERLTSLIEALQRPSGLIPPRLFEEARSVQGSFDEGDCAKGG